MRSVAGALLLASASLLAATPARAQALAWDDGTVPFVVTPMEVVHRMLQLAEVRRGDHVIDLGSGDGRIVIEAARRGATGLGVDIDPTLVEQAAQNAEKAGVAERARFERRDIFDTDLSKASVITMYLLPDFNAKLLPRLLALKPGTRIVSHDGEIGDWPADETLEMRTPEKSVGLGGRSTVQLWVVPADASGVWVSDIPEHGGRWRFSIRQRYQVLETQIHAQARDLLMRASRLRGEEIKLVVSGIVGNRAWHHLFVGLLRGDRIAGQLVVSDGERQRTFPWTATRIR
jgi:SAM-dependent methyltransferase